MKNAASILRRLFETVSFSLFVALVLAAASCYPAATAWAQSNPVPLINQPLVPDAAAPGSQGFTLTVNGNGFVSGAVVQWNGSALSTTFVSILQLTASVPASDIGTPGTATVTVVNPGVVPSNWDLFETTVSSASVTFGESNVAVADQPVAVVTADFNGDGKLDLAITNQLGATGVWVVLGNGDGTFGPATLYNTGGNFPSALAVGDFNGDGNLDLAVPDEEGEVVGVLLGNGDGTFGPAATFPVQYDATQAIVADFNHDGKLDLAIAAGYGISVLLGNGDGTFQPQVVTAVAGQQIATGDLNGDGDLDLVDAVGGGDELWVLLGNGTVPSSPLAGTFRA